MQSIHLPKSFSLKRLFYSYTRSLLFLFLLPVFFVWHGYVQFYNLIDPGKALILLLWYLAGTACVYFISWLVFRNRGKAAVFSFFLMCLYFFFGSYQDWVNEYFTNTFVTRYSFILPAILVVFISLFIYLKRIENISTRAYSYLNTLFLVLIIVDSVTITLHLINNRNITTKGTPPALTICKECAKPDIYFIVADGYSGNIPLQKFFNFDNSGFENQLKERGFHVIDSSFSNYEYTVFSVGSTLNMDYLNTRSFFRGNRDLALAFNSVKKNRFTDYILKHGYKIHNYSMFDFMEQPATLRKFLEHFDRSPLTTQTFIYRARKDIGYHLIKIFPFLQKKKSTTLYNELKNNIMADSLTRHTAGILSNKPKFVYSHLMLPHPPYYFDSSGNLSTEKELTSKQFHSNKSAYISYLKYSNKILLDLVDSILLRSARPPIIILTGDHGSRDCLDQPEEIGFQHMNLSAVYMPDKKYSKFYKGMSNVNLFRTVINSQFHQKIKILKDSAIYIRPDRTDLH